MLIDLLVNRRSIRRYDAQPVEEETVRQLLQAALLSPSSRGIRPWEFVVVNETELIRELAESRQHGSSFLADAPLAVAVLGIPEASDVWIEDCAIAASSILLAAEDAGLGACWVQIRQRPAADGRSADEYVRDVLRIPSNRSVEAVIALGYPAEEPNPHNMNDLNWDKVYFNRRS